MQSNPPQKKTILIATRNEHKIWEIRALLGDRFQYLSLSSFPDCPSADEDQPTFMGNAVKKSVTLANWLATHAADPEDKEVQDIAFVLADDSGLEVDALNGAPGVLSARYSSKDPSDKANSPDDRNNEKLLKELKKVPEGKRLANFRCVITLTPVAPEKEARARTEIFSGVCEGKIGTKLSGEGGFGYDPLFIPEGFDRTFAELGADTKNQLSHRARALMKLRNRLDFVSQRA